MAGEQRQPSELVEAYHAAQVRSDSALALVQGEFSAEGAPNIDDKADLFFARIEELQLGVRAVFYQLELNTALLRMLTDLEPEQPAVEPYVGELALSTTRAAEFLGTSPGTVRRWADEGELQHFRTPGNQRRFSIPDLQHFKDLLRSD